MFCQNHNYWHPASVLISLVEFDFFDFCNFVLGLTAVLRWLNDGFQSLRTVQLLLLRQTKSSLKNLVTNNWFLEKNETGDLSISIFASYVEYNV
jgi:hypothetical protein